MEKYFPGKTIKVEKHLITRWMDEEFSLGSYSHYTVGSSVDDFLNLFEPEGRLFFAGEHTDQYFASLYGACSSGNRAASKILDLIKNTDVEE